MKTILNILLAVPVPVTQDNLPVQMNNATWLVTGVIIAVLLIAYLIMFHVKSGK